MFQGRVMRMIAVIVILSMMITPVAYAEVQPPVVSDGPTAPAEKANAASPRLIIELDSPPLAAAYLTDVTAAAVNGRLDANAAAAQAYINQLRAEQALFVNNMKSALADATVATFRNEVGVTEEATYQIVFNGLAINPGATPKEDALRKLVKLPGVKNVYFDTPHYTQLYTSTTLINAPAIWNTVGGRANGGAGIKVASMDGGVHYQAAMMNGAGYSYPPGYGPNGLGLTTNNNGKIIASRAYFRTWDPPASGDENPWPGKNGTSHGMHTSSTAAGGIVTATYNGFNVGTISGVAPRAYVMSYRVFYESVNGIGSFYTTEGIAALEDIVQDGADVVNNSWGGGPGSIGGEFDPLDTALINATKAGVFVSMSNGNSGPGLGTGDHPSPHYINVAASTTGGTLASGKVSVPNEATLQDLAFSTASFGAELPIGQVQDFTYLPAGVANAANIEGCNAWPADSFTGKAALIRRGSCEFGVKVLNAEKAGATFVVVYNNATGGDGLINMGPGAVGNQVTIPSIFIGRTNGEALVNLYNTQGAAAAILRVDTKAFQAGSDPDRIIGFSSRGPGVGDVLKPDIAAPGVNILAQGYTEGVTGEARHLGYGQASGTSMASPHVAGAAALLQQRHPTWSVAAIKSALMSTSKYMDIYLADGTTPAQPLDMGAGRLDLAKAADPGVILDPPSLSFGFVPTGTQKTITVTGTSVASAAETYALSTLYTGDGFAPTQTKAITAITANVSSISLNPGESKKVAITFNSATSMGIGDNQGYVIMDGPTHDAHMAAWARVVPAAPVADVLLIDGDFSTLGPTFNFPLTDYRWYYIDTLEKLGYTYHVLNYDLESLPDAATLSGYKAILYFTGENFVNGAGLADLDMNKLVEYLNAGGSVIVMGQDMAATIDNDQTDPSNPDYFYQSRLGANWIQDSISGSTPINAKTPTSYIRATTAAPVILADVVVDLTQLRQVSAAGPLSGTQEVTPVVTLTKGSFSIFHDIDRNYTEFQVTVTPSTTQPITLTGMHIHVGAVGVNGPVIRNLATLSELTLPRFITRTLRVSGVISPSLNATELQQIARGDLYINVHTTAHPTGELRGQIELEPLANQPYVDEIDNAAHDGSQAPNGDDNAQSIPLLSYMGPNNVYHGTVAMGHRRQPSLEEPGITYAGRSVYATFGLEGMNNSFSAGLGFTPTTRSELLGAFLDWTWAPAPTTVQITNTVAVSSTLHQFSASAAYGLQGRSANTLFPRTVQYRWDFGDGSPYVISVGSQASHQYLCGADNQHTMRVEITDNYGNVIIGTKDVDVSKSCTTNVGPKNQLYLPVARK